jgi:hypothetical protein
LILPRGQIATLPRFVPGKISISSAYLCGIWVAQETTQPPIANGEAMAMTGRNALFTASVLAATFLECAALVTAAERMILKVPDSSGQYCHLKFPAITRDSLFTDRPVLKDPSEGDIIDFYGACDHDPLGKAEIDRQKADRRRQFTRPAD